MNDERDPDERGEKPIRFWCLENVEFLRNLTEVERAEFLKQAQVYSYRKDQLIFQPGDLCDTVYFVEEGLVKIYQVSPAGRKLTLMLLCGRGQPFGVMALAECERRQFYAQALAESRICLISRNYLRYFTRKNMLVCCKIIKLMGSRQTEIRVKLEEMVFKTVPQRLATLLLKLSIEFGEQTPDGRRIGIAFTHQELAELIGASREHVVATLKRFRERQFITLDPARRIILGDELALHQQANV